MLFHFKSVLFFYFVFCGLLTSYAQHLPFHQLNVSNGLPHNTVESIVQDKYGFMWLATQEGLCRFDGVQVRTYYANQDSTTPLNNRPVSMIKDMEGQIWVSFSSTQELCLYRYATDDFKRVKVDQIPTKIRQAFHEYRQKSLSAQTRTGDGSWVINDGNLWQDVGDNKQTLIRKHVKSICLDQTEVLWIATQDVGVLYVDTRKPKIDFKGIEGAGVIRSISTDLKGDIWIGSQDEGLWMKPSDKNSVIPIANLHSAVTASNKESKQIRKIFHDTQGVTWIGTRYGVYRYGEGQQKKHYHTQNGSGVPHNWVYAIYQDKNNVLWIGTWNGIAWYDHTRDRFVSLPVSETLPHPAVRSMVSFKKGELCVATENGLAQLQYTYHNNKVDLLSYRHFFKEKNISSLNDNFIYALDTDIGGNLWIGTRQGVNKLHLNDQQFKHFPNDPVLASAIIRSITCVDDEVWVSHQNGLTRIRGGGESIRHFNRSDGLVNLEFAENASFNDENKRKIYLGGDHFLVSLSPAEIADNEYPAPLVFTKLLVNNIMINADSVSKDEAILRAPIWRTRAIVFDHHMDNFELQFATLQFNDPQKHRFAFKLEGVDQDWRFTEYNNPTVFYASLPSGKYTFRLKGTNSDGVWNKDELTLAIEVLPPWWKSLPAYIVYAILLLCVFVIVFRHLSERKKLQYRLSLEAIKAEKSQEIAAMRTSFLTNISHELRTPITLILDPVRRLIEEGLSAEERRNMELLIQRHAKRLLYLINQLLDFRRIEVGRKSLQLGVYNLVDFIAQRTAMFLFAASQKNLTIGFENQHEQVLWEFDADIVDKILVNLLSNAVKYSDTHATIHIRLIKHIHDVADLSLVVGQLKQDHHLMTIGIEIKDHGIGIAAEEYFRIFELFEREDHGTRHSDGSGIGLALVKELTLLHEGAISLVSDVEGGSTFTFYLQQKADVDHSRLEVEIQKPTILAIPEDFATTPVVTEVYSQEINPVHTVLVIEDNVDILDYVAANLSTDYKVYCAQNGEQGSKMAFEMVPDLIISDVMMPDVSGVALCRQFKEDERTSHIPIILLTAKIADESVFEGYEQGADDYITKPFNVNILIVRVKNLIDSRRRLRQLFSEGTPLEIEKVAITTIDKSFLLRAIDIVHQNLDNILFTPDRFAAELGISRAQLFRKIKALTDQTVIDFVTTIRLKKAGELLQNSSFSIKEIASMTGFSEASNFSRAFNKKYGVTPSEFSKGHL